MTQDPTKTKQNRTKSPTTFRFGAKTFATIKALQADGVANSAAGVIEFALNDLAKKRKVTVTVPDEIASE